MNEDFSPNASSSRSSSEKGSVVVDNMDNAVTLSKKYKYAFKIVTLEGDIINPSGQMTGGSVEKKTSSILGRNKEIEQLEKEMKEKEESPKPPFCTATFQALTAWHF